MSTKVASLKFLGVTLLVLLKVSVGLASMNLWDALVNPNKPPVPPTEYESNLCALPNMDCYPCSHYSNNYEECDRIQECAFDCKEKTCKDIKDPTLNKPNQDCYPCDHYSNNIAECDRIQECEFDCEEKTCKDIKDPTLNKPNIDCYPCSHYNNNIEECDRMPECAFDCREKTCKDIKDPTLNQANMDCYPCSHHSNNFAECDRIQKCEFDCEEKTCKDIKDPTLNKPNQVCHPCDYYSKNHSECNRKPNCAFDCYNNKCKNKKDPSLRPNKLHCTSQCSNPCGCQAQPGCFYSDISTSIWTSLTQTENQKCVPVESSGELTQSYFDKWECYRGSPEPYEYYFHNGKLSPLVNQEDKGTCDVENIAGEYIREFEGVFDEDGSHPCITVSTKVSDSFWEAAEGVTTFGFFELVVVFDKLDDWLPTGEHRVFSVSMFNAFRWSVTLRRDNFAEAEKIKIYWSFNVGSKSESNHLRYLTVKGFNHGGTYLELNSFDIQVCDQPINSCFRGQGIVRPASITVNKFKPEEEPDYTASLK